MKLFVAYLRRDLSHSAPFVLLGIPYFFFMWFRKWTELHHKQSASSAADQIVGSLELVWQAYPNWYEESMDEDCPDDLDSIIPARNDRTGTVNDDREEQGSSNIQRTKWENSVKDRQKKIPRVVLPAKTLQWIARVQRLYKTEYPDEDETTLHETETGVKVSGFEVMQAFETHIKNTIKTGSDEEFEFEALRQEQKSLTIAIRDLTKKVEMSLTSMQRHDRVESEM